MHVKTLVYSSKYGIRPSSSKIKFTFNFSCNAVTLSPKLSHGRCDPQFKHGIWAAGSCCAAFIGKPLMSNRNSSFPIPLAHRFSVDSKRCLSLESLAQAQSNVFVYLSESTPVYYSQKFFEFVHDTSGLPWWASIILSTVVVRAVVAFPLALHQNYIIAKVQNLQHEMRDISKRLGMEVSVAMKKYGWSTKQAQIHYKHSLKKQWDGLVVRDNCHPFKASLPIWFQMPMWVFLSISLRNMAFMLPHRDTAAELIYLQLSHGGCLWFPNLIDVDHSLILPVTLAFLNLAIVEVQCMIRIKEPTKFQRNLTNFIRLVSIAMIPIASSVPACMSLYWVASSACGLLQNLIVLSPRVKKWAGIPKVKPLPGVSDAKREHLPNADTDKKEMFAMEQQEYLHNHPYRFLASEISNRMNRVGVRLGLGKGI